MKRPTVILGPQRLQPTLEHAVPSVREGDGPVALITAGWEEREGEDQELVEHLGLPSVNLRLFGRAEEAFERDPELLRAMRSRYDTLRRLQGIYRLRLDHALEAARELLALPEQDDDLVEEERRSAIGTVRRLDQHQLERTAEVNADFDERWRPAERDHLRGHREQLASILSGASAVCVAGGHVAILLNRLRMFDLAPLLKERPVVAWSAGAMALSERIVLFHDSPPQGRGNAEVFQPGVGHFGGVVPLPHAKRRLLLDDPVRVGLFARRFGPDLCVALDEGSRLDQDGARWVGADGTRRLTEHGWLEQVEQAA